MLLCVFFFFNDTATTEIYTLSLHDALPISYLEIITRKTASLCATCCELGARFAGAPEARVGLLELYGLSVGIAFQIDRKSTRLNSSHANISYAVFCLKKKKKIYSDTTQVTI